MRLSAFTLALVMAGCCVGASACATSGAAPSSYNTAMQTLETTCHDRGGILVSSGATTGRVETDFFCKITGAASRLPG